MNKRIANHIYNILVQECGAPEKYRDYFIEYLSKEHPANVLEFRFGGDLGTGGKFHLHRSRNFTEWRVSYYHEESTEARDIMLDYANKRLADMNAIYRIMRDENE